LPESAERFTKELVEAVDGTEVFVAIAEMALVEPAGAKPSGFSGGAPVSKNLTP
jgi:hypothetical protein